MKELFDDYFQRLLAKFDEVLVKNIQIVSRDGRIIAKSNPDNADIKKDIIQSLIYNLDLSEIQPILYDNSGEYTIVATTLVVEQQLIAIILVETMNLKRGEHIATTIRMSLETYIEHQYAVVEASTERSREETVIKELLEPKSQDLSKQTISYKAFKSLKEHGIDLFLLRSVILVKLEKKTNNFFNINLDLGYEASVENFKDKVVNVIKTNKHLNKQDIVAFLDQDHIVIIKSFLSVGNTNKLYSALDTISQSIMYDLDAAKIFAYRMAYGGIYSNFFDIKQSYIEAADTLLLGGMFQENTGIYQAEQGLLEHICYYLPAIIRDKSIQNILGKLRKTDGNIDIDLLYTVEEFINQCMNLTRTANSLYLHRNTVSSKIEKFKQKTGLDPEKSFEEAFLIKITAISIKIEQFNMKK